MNDRMQSRLEALKLVKEWSNALVIVQSGAIAVIGALLPRLGSNTPILIVVAFLFITMISGIVVGVNFVMGTIPYIVQNVSSKKNWDIYEQCGGIRSDKFKFSKENLGKYCLWQSNFFIASLILFAVLVMQICLLPPSK